MPSSGGDVARSWRTLNDGDRRSPIGHDIWWWSGSLVNGPFRSHAAAEGQEFIAHRLEGVIINGPTEETLASTQSKLAAIDC